jgi:hypothetical protein
MLQLPVHEPEAGVCLRQPSSRVSNRRRPPGLKSLRWLGEERSVALRLVCSEMWKPYLKVITKKAA